MSEKQSPPNTEFPSQSPYYPPPDDFISLAELVRMVWRHRRKIIIVSGLVTLVVAVITLMSPRPFEASAMMEVMPEYGRDGRVDKDLFETSILTHLETAKSPVIGMSVLKGCRELQNEVNLQWLMNKITVSRPTRTSIIQCKITMPSKEKALKIVDAWRNETLHEIERKSIEKALIFVRGRMRDLQEQWLSHTAALNEARRIAEQLEDHKLVTVSRSVDDTVLWQDLVKASENEALKRMGDIHLKSQEINQEYLDARNRLADNEQRAAAAIMSRAFYFKVVTLLEELLDSPSVVFDYDDSEDEIFREALDYVKALTRAKEIVPLGSPVVYHAPRGAAKKTVIAGFGVFMLSCMLAFAYEWAKQAGLE